MFEEKKSQLNQVQFEVTQNNGTEVPYENQYWNFFEPGLYVDIVSEEPLFLSLHKFESSCGWPSFYQPYKRENVVFIKDKSHGMIRTEVRSRLADSHLGHVFTDGPAPTGLRFCINSAALSFISLNDITDPSIKALFNLPEVKEENIEYATFGAGCFWGVEAIFAKTRGVLDAVSGYMGGETPNPTYEQICTGKTGHAEVVQVKFNHQVISYEELLDLFFRLHDPTTLNKQGPDIGTQYRSAIFFHSKNQEELAQQKIKQLTQKKSFLNPIVTEINSFETFYPAEEYHQDYYEKKYQGKMGPICHFVRDFNE